MPARDSIPNACKGFDQPALFGCFCLQAWLVDLMLVRADCFLNFRRFLEGHNFMPWFRRKRAAVEQEQHRLWRQARINTDIHKLISKMSEVEIVDSFNAIERHLLGEIQVVTSLHIWWTVYSLFHLVPNKEWIAARNFKYRSYQIGVSHLCYNMLFYVFRLTMPLLYLSLYGCTSKGKTSSYACHVLTNKTIGIFHPCT